MKILEDIAYNLFVFFVPHFVEDECGCIVEPDGIMVIGLTSIMTDSEKKHLRYTCRVKSFNLFGFGLFPKLVKDSVQVSPYKDK